MKPLESGGVIARNGFGFQDHVAATFCVRMLTDGTMVEVWCETLDDITVVWNINGKEIFEFVQVKSNELDQLWSVPVLCKRPKKGSKRRDSIVEKSLAYDRGDEDCRFRLVTALGFKKDLIPLTFEYGQPGRICAPDIAAMAMQFKKSLRAKVAPTSPKGNGLDSWLERLVLHCVSDSESLAAKNKMALMKACGAHGLQFEGDHLDYMYEQLVRYVYEAAKAPWDVDPDQKKIDKSSLLDLLRGESERAGMPTMTAGTALRRKMKAAGFDDTAVKSALELRRKFRSRSLDPSYVGGKAKEYREAAYVALHRLRGKLASDLTVKDGLAFQERCCNKLEQIAASAQPQDRSLETYLIGFMYDVTDRCEHKFTR
ncbi:MAG: DUF4297 domain-containing protein [Deltaproteobacteria bacterium]|nr:DUF4297 domain-containing protein [Deltaproteobacteria bacterium]